MTGGTGGCHSLCHSPGPSGLVLASWGPALASWTLSAPGRCRCVRSPVAPRSHPHDHTGAGRQLGPGEADTRVVACRYARSLSGSRRETLRLGIRTSDSKPEEDPSFGDERDTIRARAAQAGVKYEVSRLEDQITLLIEIPNGREPPRRVRVTPELANILSCVPFEHVVALGNYDAVWDSSTGLIEASFRATSISPGLLRLARHPQVRPIDTGQDSLPVSDDEEDLFIPVQPGVPRRQEWMLRLGSEDEKFAIEISPPTGLAVFLSQGSTIKAVRRPTLKISGLTFSRHDEALKALENISSAFIFELDMLDDITLTLYRGLFTR